MYGFLKCSGLCMNVSCIKNMFSISRVDGNNDEDDDEDDNDDWTSCTFLSLLILQRGFLWFPRISSH